jgi:UDP-N-acetylglucosamine 2-epimerase (non-hydrolysing)
MRVVCVAAARPNFAQVGPVTAALERRGVEVVLVYAGQHHDRGMGRACLDELGIRTPDFQLGVGAGRDGVQTGRAMAAFEPLLDGLVPEVVVVVGDLTPAVACAIAAAKSGALVAHVESGLRGRDWSVPEEVNRVVADRVSDYLLAPSPDAVTNLGLEGYRPDQVHLVGSVLADTVLANVERARGTDIHRRLGVAPDRYGVVTLRSPANVDEPGRLTALIDMLSELADECPLVFPVHPRTRHALTGASFGPALRLVTQLGYLDFLALQAGARIVLTDSGGVQDETTVLGVPCLTVRDSTERPITVAEGTNQLAGVDPGRILTLARHTLAHPPRPRRPALWDGHAADRVADVLLTDPPRARRRPTELAR